MFPSVPDVLCSELGGYGLPTGEPEAACSLPALLPLPAARSPPGKNDKDGAVCLLSPPFL